MPSDLMLNGSGDLTTVDGDLVVLTASDAIVQQVRIRLRLFFAEWFLDNRIGVHYYQTILVKNPVMADAEAELKRTILGTGGIARLTSFSLDHNRSTRRLNVRFRAVTTDGDSVTVSEVLGA